MKNQFKKSLSLIMAVLMLMSCWVWVAPTEAEAATQDYYVKVKFTITNECEGGGHIQVKYWNFNANGTVNTNSGGTKDIVTSLQGMAEQQYERDTTVPGFPYMIVVKTVSVSAKNSYVALESITVGDRVVSGDFDRYEVKNTEITFGIDANGNKSGSGWGNFTIDWPFPKFGLDESKSDTSLDITSVPGSATASFAFKDINYNTPWPHTITQNAPSIVLQKDGLSKTGMSAVTNGTTNTTVNAAAGADRHNPGNSDSSWTLKASFTSGDKTSGTTTVTPIVDINLTHPEYTITFDGNGGKLDASDAAAITGVYGTKIGHYPTMYDYKGNQLEGYSTSKTGGTVLGETALKETQITGNQTYYARWVPKDVDVVFLTADGQTVTTLTAKYGKTLLEHFGTLNAINNAVQANQSGFAFVNGNQLAWSKDGIEYEFAGWRVIDAWDLDENKITALNGQTHDEAVLQGKTAFQATYRPKSMKNYTVKFFGTNGEQLSQKTYNYGQALTQPASPSLAEDAEFTYEHAGWAKKVSNSVKYYTVDENGNDINGSPVLYVSKDIEYFAVEGDAEYVPVFKRTNKEYTITYKYYDNNKVEKEVKVEGVYYGAVLEAPEDVIKTYTNDGERFNFSHWETEAGTELGEATCTGDMTVWMKYLPPIPAVYTINFYDMYGNLINGDNNQYTHNATVTEPTYGPVTEGDTEEYDIPYKIDTDTVLYTFTGFRTKDGGAVSNTATADASYYAKYSEKVYANIAYYNEGVLVKEIKGKEHGYFVDDVIPAYENIVENEDGATENVLPAKAEDAVGTYAFTGWADGSGTTVTPGVSKFTSSDMRLYAQYATTYKEYTVKFMNEDEIVSEKTYHYGEPITVPSEEPTKAEDESYTYTFRAWSPDVSEVCYGNVTYTANYRKTPKYYPVTWYKDDKTALIESHYTYDSKIQPAVIKDPAAYPAAGTGYSWVWKAWIQCNADGEPIDENGNVVTVPGTVTDFEEQIDYIYNNAAKFVRGIKMGTEHLYFYPIFEKAANTYTIKFHKADGTFVGEVTAPHDAPFADYEGMFATDATTEADDDHHYRFDGWVNFDGTNLNLKDDQYVISDMTVKAVCTAEAHNKVIYEVIKAPTCTETGIVNKKCDTETCNIIDEEVIEPVIPDFGAPVGQIYVGTDKWTLENYTAGINYTDVKYVGPNTNVIVNAQDTNTWSRPWNLDGKISRGVGKIDFYVHESTQEDATKDPTAITSWTNVYDYNTVYTSVLEEVLLGKGISEDDYYDLSFSNAVLKNEIDDEVKAILANYNANATGILSNLDLVNGKEYIIYIRVSDREVSGESNKCYFSSGKLHYGSTAAEIAVSGDGYGTKFCAEATVAVNDDTDGFKVYLDGEEVTLTNGKFVCSTKGVHTVTVIDKNGNKTIKTFEIKGNHTYRNYTTAATCENAGSRYDLCTVCGVKANETPLPALGHSFTVNYIDKAADCINDGSRTYACDNNCGTKLVLKPTDDAETIAQAKKWVDTAGEDGKGAWVALTVVDLASLKATGEHTYAKVKDEDGEDTSEDAWIIDKAATCSAVGSKHKDCTVCGIIGRVTEEIPLDTENGHKFYREQVASEPLCQEIGKKTKICRYCGYEETTSYIPALGHVAGEYVILKEATCTEAGWAMLTCSRCDCYIGEGEYDPMKEPVAKKLDPLGHKWKIDGEVYSEEVEQEGGTITVWYQNYKCAVCGETEKRKLEDYKPPVAATITFDFNGGYYTIPAVGTPDQLGYVPEMLKGTQAISTVVGETIIATDVEAAFKLNNATKIYTFSHWEDAEGKEVKFPIEVKGDATYYAVYTEKFINYTITYYQEDGITEFKKTGYLHNGEEVALAAGPAKAATNLVTYKFAGWAVIGTNPEVVYTDKVTIDGANINLKAKYTEIKKQYAVTYAYSKSDILETFAVEAGQPARDCLITPVKDADSKYHYEFKAWNKAAQLVKVESNIYTTPDFDPVLHSYTHEGGKVLVAEATCTTKAKYKYTCICGFSYEKEEGEVLGHDWGEPVYDAETGVNIVECSRCKVSDQDTRTFTAKFFVDATQKLTISYIPWGTMIDETRLPADPTKETTATTEYTFKGWAVKDDATQAIVDFKNFAIKKDCDFVAVFTETTRKYNVIFGYDAKNIIKTFIDVPAGSDVTFDLTEVPVKEFDDTYHYDFSGWKGYKEGVLNITVEDVQETLRIYAEFTKTKHDYKNITDLEEATCQNGAGKRYSCDCGAYYDVTGKPLDHEWKEIERVEATEKKDGYIKYECQNDGCDETKTETLTWVSDKITLEVKVLRNGEAQSNVSVQFVEKNGAGATIPATTGKDGIAKVVATKSDDGYACYVNIDGEMVLVTDFAEGSNGNYTGTYAYTVAQADCSCACHRDNFWGVIFRFIHKIIKFFTGEFKCCGNPDPMYG